MYLPKQKTPDDEKAVSKITKFATKISFYLINIFIIKNTITEYLSTFISDQLLELTICIVIESILSYAVKKLQKDLISWIESKEENNKS